MKEIIYIQAGNYANYVGTHFWNTQETYLGEDDTEHSVTHDWDVSFREGLSPTGEPTVCPRLLIFDKKANFGTLSRSNALLGGEEVELPNEDHPAIWNGDVMEYRQDRIPESQYYSHIGSPLDQKWSDRPGDADVPQTGEDIRYWSDFSRVYYLPRTIQTIPDHGHRASTEGDWNMEQDEFFRYNEDTALMEGSFRLFLEECDSLQGIQIMNDTSSFGGFINSFIVALRDESVKLPCLVFPLLSDAVSRHNDVHDNKSMRKIINDALYLRSLHELVSMSVPIQAPFVWPSAAWNQSLATERSSMYHNSAILSAHLESSTLSLRLKGTSDDLANMSSQLNWRGSTPFGELSGILPLTSVADFNRQLVNFSTGYQKPNDFSLRQFARRDVTRGFSMSDVSAYNSWSASLSLQETFISRFHAPPYPIPTTYPLFSDTVSTSTSSHPGILTRPCALFSSIASSSSTGTLFSTYAISIEGCLKRGPIAETVGMDKDELRELANDLWSLHDNFHDDGGSMPNDDGSTSLGEDEE
ncbi:tubulin nucleotide-binding domain-like protein [Tricholoma matsutake]|nr:tubulin nucleotide-binding domain-like protein [Tricholoma matsutake 945]